MPSPTQDQDIRNSGAGADGTGPSDEALLVAVGQRRDKAAFVQLFERYAGRVKAYLLRGGTAPGIAEDAAQEVMLALWRRAEIFDPERASAATWIFTIARNKRIDLLRRENRGLPEPDDPLMDPGNEEGAERRFSAAERDALVRGAIAELGEDQRMVVRLSFFSEKSHAEIAAELGLPLGTVKSRLRLAFQRLRGALGNDFWTELIDD
ncbi:MAG: sigma-70 family RNA polymerase sigma factor [Pseudomonadota bacterium]